jgi:hypothetical protein
MGRRRFWLVGLVVALLALLGTACEPAPTPQMELTLRVNPTGYVDILTNRIKLSVSVSCTRAALVRLTPSVVLDTYGDVRLEAAENQSSGISCDGPQIGNWIPIWWRIPAPYPPAPPTSLRVTMLGETYRHNIPPIDYDAAVARQTVTLTSILCWPGTNDLRCYSL